MWKSVRARDAYIQEEKKRAIFSSAAPALFYKVTYNNIRLAHVHWRNREARFYKITKRRSAPRERRTEEERKFMVHAARKRAKCVCVCGFAAANTIERRVINIKNCYYDDMTRWWPFQWKIFWLTDKITWNLGLREMSERARSAELSMYECEASPPNNTPRPTSVCAAVHRKSSIDSLFAWRHALFFFSSCERVPANKLRGAHISMMHCVCQRARSWFSVYSNVCGAWRAKSGFEFRLLFCEARRVGFCLGVSKTCSEINFWQGKLTWIIWHQRKLLALSRCALLGVRRLLCGTCKRCKFTRQGFFMTFEKSRQYKALQHL